MRVLVTGGAGFIGSHLTAALHEEGHDVTVVDCLTPYYPPETKEANLLALALEPDRILRIDLRTASLEPLLDGMDVVFHLAAQPGVRASWKVFDTYVSHNLTATQKVLEAARLTGVGRVVLASSSSVYGNATAYPTAEDDRLRPRSPYGVTKRAVEDLTQAYADNWGLSAVLLRYFTVYGPRQRPDMAFHRIIESALTGAPFPLFGTGGARRDFTYVGDAVAATVAAGTAPLDPGTPINVAGGEDASMSEVLHLVGELVGRPVPLDRQAAQHGDVDRTGGDTTRARDLLGYAPRVGLKEGLSRQLAWHREVAHGGPAARM